MEKIIEFEGDNDREIEASTSANATIVKQINNSTQLDNQSDNLLSASASKQRCGQPDQTATESVSQARKPSAGLKSTKKINNFRLTMLLQYSKEFLGFLALILTTYATLLNKEPIIGGTLAPRPIFAKDSIVQEWPHGQLVDVQAKVAVSELSLIFFYAPWCAESLFAKKVYNAVANVYSKEVYFAAVNCWQPGSGCRTNYSNVYKWPVLMAYLPNAFSVQYTGTWTYSSLAKFIDRLLSPMQRIDSVQELMQLRITNDATVLGVFNSSDSKEYKIFFQTAIKWLECEAFQNAKFAVYIGERTSMFSQSERIQAPVIKLFTTNDTIVYNNTRWESKKIVNSLKQYLAKSSIWVNLPSIKSSTMRKHLLRGPVLLMFAPRVPYSQHYFIMKQLIYSHPSYRHNLNKNVLNSYITHHQKEYPVRLKKLSQFCHLSKRMQYQDVQTGLYNQGLWNGGLFSVDLQTVNTSKHLASTDPLRGAINTCDYKFCEQDFFGQNVYQRSSGKYKHDRMDYRSPSELLKNSWQKQCLQLEKLPPSFFQKNIAEYVNTSMLLQPEGVQNRTLSFLMLDSIVYNDYLRHFIGDLEIQKNTSPSPALFIIDNQGETVYRHKNPISTTSAMEFVGDFYKGKLRRHLRSSAMSETRNRSTASPTVAIRDINSRIFAKLVHRTNATSVVLFYSPHCSLCYVMSQALLHVSHMMQLRNVAFYRMDGSTNDVTWEYTMDKYPTLMVFPQNRSVDTNVYPSTLEISVKNVFGFILSKLKPEQKLKSLGNACILTKLSAAFQSCVRHVREMINSEIDRCLQQWHRTPSHRKLILKRLNMFKEIYLELIGVRRGSELEHILNDIITYENGEYSYVF